MKASHVPHALAVFALAVVLAACSPSPAPTGEGETPVAVPTPRPTAVIDVPIAPATVPPVAPAAPAPTELTIGGLGVDMPIVPVGVQEDGSMEIPKQPSVAGWYRYSSAPSSDTGALVLAAHVDSRIYGLGPLSELRYAEAGESVTVVDAAGTPREYTIESVTYIARSALPVSDLFQRTGESSLVIITCGGEFDEATRSYSDNVVAVASPVL